MKICSSLLPSLGLSASQALMLQPHSYSSGLNCHLFASAKEPKGHQHQPTLQIEHCLEPSQLVSALLAVLSATSCLHNILRSAIKSELVQLAF